jgi:DNA-binding transcriptional MerR regulator
MNDHASWTLAELTDRVGAALAVGYQGQSSGRIRDLPDQRAIRWYTTLGLVDRPGAMRGRTALYGRRHLLQLVAIKRLQAAGRTLAEVQEELAAASDERLERVADLPVAATASRQPAPASPPAAVSARRSFWAAGVAAAEAPAARAAATGPVAAADTGEPVGAEGASPPDRPAVSQLQAVQLADGLTLLLGAPEPLDGDDLLALQAAARPLLAVVRARGLHRHATGRELP